MIEPWQVWLVDFDPIEGHDGSVRPAVTVSSDLHLRSQNGRGVLVCPVTSRDKKVRNHVKITNAEGQDSFVMTEQIRYISTRRFVGTSPSWGLHRSEIDRVAQALRFMMDI